MHFPSILSAALAVALLAPWLLCRPAAAQPDYRLAPGDVVLYDLLNDEEQPREITIDGDGRLPVPLIGLIDVANLSVRDATEAVRERFAAQQFFVDPRPALSVLRHRPISVLGDVKSPGSYPFRTGLTVEQAVGLAGGLLAPLGSVEDRLLQRSKLQMEGEVLDAEIAREAVVVARLAAQIDGKAQIAYGSVPRIATPFVDQATFDTLQGGEERILLADRGSLEAEKKQIFEAVAETEKSLSLLADLAKAQQATIGYSKDDLARKSGLLNRGLNTIGEVSVIQRQLATDEARLLSIYAQMSDGRRSLANLKRELVKLESTRQREALQLHQDGLAKIEKLVMSRKATFSQFDLVTSWTTPAAQQRNQPVITFKIRRGPDAPLEDAATATSPVHPGDVVIVALERPIIAGTPQQAGESAVPSARAPQGMVQNASGRP